jgi:hypothetical protein
MAVMLALFRTHLILDTNRCSVYGFHGFGSDP